MKIIRLLCQHLGSSADQAYTPLREFADGDGALLEAKVSRRANWDFDAEVKIPEYLMQEIEMADWATAQFYIDNSVAWKYYIGFGASLEWPEKWFLRISKMDAPLRFASIKLLNTGRFRSTFRASLRKQLEEWLDAEELSFPSPFSYRQAEILVDVRTAREAKARATSLYLSA